VFSNLISNKKYNDKVDKWVEIGFWTLPDPQKIKYKSGEEKKPEQSDYFFLQDNGIGIRKILGYHFSHFKRLHASTNMEVERVLG